MHKFISHGQCIKKDDGSRLLISIIIIILISIIMTIWISPVGHCAHKFRSHVRKANNVITDYFLNKNVFFSFVSTDSLNYDCVIEINLVTMR